MMPDREKVIKGLQAHADGCGYRSHHCDAMDCPYRYGDESCDIEEMCRDALELLKEQEAIKPFSDDDGAYWCGSCHEDMVWHQKFCSNCGKPVLWEGR